LTMRPCVGRNRVPSYRARRDNSTAQRCVQALTPVKKFRAWDGTFREVPERDQREQTMATTSSQLAPLQPPEPPAGMAPVTSSRSTLLNDIAAAKLWLRQ